MAHFYGTLQGSRGEATRLGTKNSGIMTTTCSYQGKVRVCLNFDPRTGQDIATISLAKHMGKGVERTLFKGPVGEKPVNEAMPGLLYAARGMIHYCCVSPAELPEDQPTDSAAVEGYEAAKVMRKFLRTIGVEAPGMEGTKA